MRLSAQTRQSGFTLIEIVFVIALVVIISTVVATRFEAINSLRTKNSIRHFINTWEFLYSQAKAKNETFVLSIDMENNSYQVRAAKIKENSINNREVLNDFRTKSEQERLKREKEEKSTADKAYIPTGDDSLESQFYKKIFNDPHADYELITPQDFPSLAREQFLSSDVKIKDVKIGNEYYINQKVDLTFSANGAADFAIVHFETESKTYTTIINPATGKVKLYDKEIDFDWALEKDKKN
ncbi:MAG: type II secretion system protein [Proteobacteria bacterium]|nr:type II secretion system protein [Pseudomonadota bacterium]